MRSAMTLSNEIVRFGAHQKSIIEDRLLNGCWCGAVSASLCKRKIQSYIAIYLQCEGCGNSLSSALPRAEHPIWQSYPQWDENLRKEYEARRSEEAAERTERFNANRNAPDPDYATFLQSAEWAIMRGRVMVRANRRCESCLSAEATEVHHVHYQNGWMPPAWDLRAVCRPCHDATTSIERQF